MEHVVERWPDLGAANSVLVEEESLEDGVVEASPCWVVGLAVELSDVGQECEALFEDVGAGGDGGACLAPFCFDAGAVFAELVDARADLVLREAFFGEVEESLFSGVEFGETFGERCLEVADAGLLVGEGVADAGRDEVGEVVAEVESLVVLHDVMLYERDRQVRQVAEALLAVDAEVVLVLAAVAGDLGVDELAASSRLLASSAVELLLEVVEVGAVASGGRGAFFEDLSDEREQVGRDECFVASCEEFALVGGESHVVGVGEHGVPLVDRDVLGVGVSAGAAGRQAAVAHGLGEAFE